MEIAYKSAAGRSNPVFLNLGAGVVRGFTLKLGLHRWAGTLLIQKEITLQVGPDGVWIFQAAGTFTMNSTV